MVKASVSILENAGLRAKLDAIKQADQLRAKVTKLNEYKASVAEPAERMKREIEGTQGRIRRLEAEPAQMQESQAAAKVASCRYAATTG